MNHHAYVTQSFEHLRFTKTEREKEPFLFGRSIANFAREWKWTAYMFKMKLELGICSPGLVLSYDVSNYLAKKHPLVVNGGSTIFTVCPGSKHILVLKRWQMKDITG